ncbi:hypothetical protein KDX23_18410 [Burkholderia vietnamiensis]|nr:hypothetical protein [Burkholderia vietnamiensis]
MATKRNTIRSRDVACIRIGFQEYLMDADKAMQALKLFRDAIKCDKHYHDRGYRYIAQDRPELEMTMVDPDDVVMPSSNPALEDRRR